MKSLPTIKRALPLILAGVIVSAPNANAADDKVLATVNGTPITQSQLQVYIQLNAPQTNPSDQQAIQQHFQAMIHRELLYQEAMKKKLNKAPFVAAALKDQEKKFISQAMISDVVKSTPISDKALKAAYKTRVKVAKNQTEYHTRHILLDDEAGAKKAIKRLQKGEDFAKVAKSLSKDPSGKKGGDMGWLMAPNMPTAYGDAVVKIAKGKYTTKPVQTKYGWHVIQVLDSRHAEPPPFELVKEQLRVTLQNEALGEHVLELQKKAKVSINK